MAHSVTVIVVALLQITVGKDLTWFPNSNWDNHANWNLGRLTSASEVADFSQVSRRGVIGSGSLNAPSCRHRIAL